MNAYKIPIESAFFIFPIIALIFTIPFLLYQYRKYGGVPYIKSLIIYSFILYLINALFLVILPLPSIESVSKLTTPKVQLKLFDFIIQIKMNCNLNMNSYKDIILFFKQPTVFTVLFNVLLTVPFGIYLRYFYRLSFWKTTILTLSLSLFFEITQLTGLYGIYPRPYRLFDVDDLLINTIGGVIGYIVAPMLNFVLPSSEEIEKRSYIKGQCVSLLRRMFSFTIDAIFLLFINVIVKIMFYGSSLRTYTFIISIIIYYLLLPLFLSGNTIGKIILKIDIVDNNERKKYINILFRNTIFSFLIAYPYSWMILIKEVINQNMYKRIIIVIMLNELINLIFYICNKNKQKIFFYEYISKTKLKSTITGICEQSKESKKEKITDSNIETNENK